VGDDRKASQHSGVAWVVVPNDWAKDAQELEMRHEALEPRREVSGQSNTQGVRASESSGRGYWDCAVELSFMIGERA
jgi:hypothetical protein